MKLNHARLMDLTSALDSVSSSLPNEKVSFISGRKRFQDPLTEMLPRIKVNTEGEILHMTNAARAILGFKSDAALPTSVLSYVHSKNIHALLRDISHLMQHGRKPAPWVIRLRTAQNLWGWFVVSAEQWHSESDKGVVLNLKSITGGGQPS